MTQRYRRLFQTTGNRYQHYSIFNVSFKRLIRINSYIHTNVRSFGNVTTSDKCENISQTSTSSNRVTFLDKLQNGDQKQSQQLAEATISSIKTLSGTQITNSLGALALAGHWDRKLFSEAFSKEILRRAKFNVTDQALLYDIDIAIRARVHSGLEPSIEEMTHSGETIPTTKNEAITFPTLPIDIRLRCQKASASIHNSALPLYSTLQTRLERSSKEVAYQYTVPEPSQNCAISDAYTVHIAIPSDKCVLILDGTWNTVPETDSLSLSARLFDVNLASMGWHVEHITAKEWRHVQNTLARSFEDPAQDLALKVYTRGIENASRLRKQARAKFMDDSPFQIRSAQDEFTSPRQLE